MKMVKTSSRYLYYSFEGTAEHAGLKARQYVQEFLGESQMSKSKFYLLAEEKNRLIIKCVTEYSDLIVAGIALKTKEENLRLIRISGTIRSLKTKVKKS